MSRNRLAYRDVAAATNRLTLIAALIPVGCVTVHTLFCLKTPLPADAQYFLCGMLNSFVANFFIRLWVTTHLGNATVERLPVPHEVEGSTRFHLVAGLSQKLAQPHDWWQETYCALQAAAAATYELTAADLDHVLGAFPLVNPDIKKGVRREFQTLASAKRRV